MTANEGPYVQMHGDVWRLDVKDGRVVDKVRICAPSEALAVAFMGEDGMMGSHGSAAAVRRKMERTRAGLAGLDMDPTVVEVPVHPRTLEALNQCVRSNWPLRVFVERLLALADEDASIRPAPAYPD